MSTVVNQLKTLSIKDFLFHFFIWYIIYLANFQCSKHTSIGSSWWRFESPNQWHNHISGLVQSYICVNGESRMCGVWGVINVWTKYCILRRKWFTGGHKQVKYRALKMACLSVWWKKTIHDSASANEWPPVSSYISVQHKWTKMKSCKFSYAIKKLNKAA